MTFPYPVNMKKLPLLSYTGEPSYYNEEEMMKVGDCLNDVFCKSPELKLSDIRIITPYRRQAGKLRSYIEDRFEGGENISIGSVENYQGAEKTVILVSTVRSNPPSLGDYHIGFVKNQNR